MSVRFEIEPIGTVRAARLQPVDDDWGGVESTIVLDDRFPEDALQGLETFSHVEVLFRFNRVDAEKIVTGARHPRNNHDWPAVGIFAQRGKNRPNLIGSTVCRVVRRDGRTLTVAELDAIDGTPVIDLKPVMREFLPREAVEQPGWVAQLMADYWRPER